MMTMKNKRKNKNQVYFFLFSFILFLTTTLLYYYIEPSIEHTLSIRHYIKLSIYFLVGSSVLYVFYHRAFMSNKDKFHTIIVFLHPFLFLIFVIIILLIFSEKEMRKSILLSGFFTYILYRLVFLVFSPKTNKKQ